MEGTITVHSSFETYIGKVTSWKKHGLFPWEWGGKTHVLLFQINILLTCARRKFPSGNGLPVVCGGGG